MKRVLEGLKPENVFFFFEEISRIPRGSGNEQAISDYLSGEYYSHGCGNRIAYQGNRFYWKNL